MGTEHISTQHNKHNSTYITFRFTTAADKNAISLTMPIAAAKILDILSRTPPEDSQLSQRGLHVPLNKTKSSPQYKWVVLLFRTKVTAEILTISSEGKLYKKTKLKATCIFINYN